MKNKKYKYTIYIIMLSLVITLSVVVMNKSNIYNDMKFNQDLWVKSSGHIVKNPRGKMYDDLTMNYIKNGMKKNEIEVLLGKPEIVENGGFLYIYCIGLWSGGVDEKTLELNFNANNELINVSRKDL